MGITDIESKFKALKASWVRKLENTDHCILSYLNSYVPKNIDFNYLAMTSEKRIENFEIIQAMPLFYKQVFTCFNACKNINDKLNIVHFIKQTIWSNEKFSYRGKSIYFPNWLKSNILYVKDLFTDNGVLKTPEDIMRILVNKNNWICEYKIIKSIFKRYEKKFDLTIIKHLTGGKLKSQPLNKHTTKDFYNIFVKKKFQVPIMQTKYKKEFNIAKSDWEKIYLNKVKLLQDKKIAEFNYMLLNNILSNNYFTSKINKNTTRMCKTCKEEIENSKHLILDCRNVQFIWKLVSNYVGFNIKWKHIVVGFFSVRNETTVVLNLLLSFVALKIYKYKMFCRLENKEETSEGLLNNLKSAISQYSETLSATQNTKQSSF